MAYISIVIPCYNVENLIDRCMDSIINQTIGIENLEVILVNDASTDGTYNKLLEWEAKYPDNIMVVSYDTNIRQGGARNVGLSYASSEYIGFVDSDDWIEPDMYEVLYKGMKRSNCDTVRCKYIRDEGNARIINADGSETVLLGEAQNGLYWWDENSNPDESDGGVWGGVYTRIYKRDLIFQNEILFPEKIVYEDNFWISILSLYCKNELRINRILYHYYVNTDSTIMKRDSQHHMDRLEIEVRLLEEYKKRGAFDLFRDRIMLDFLQRFYLNTYHIIFTRFTVYPEIYGRIRETVYAYFPDWVETLNNINEGLVGSIPMLKTLSEKENVTSEELSHIYWGK